MDGTPAARRHGEGLTRRFTVVLTAAVMLSTGAAAALVAQVLPGRSASTPASASTSQVTQPAITGGTGVQAPAPAPAGAAPAVVSGGS